MLGVVAVIVAAGHFAASGQLQKYIYQIHVAYLSKQEPLAAIPQQNVAFTRVNLVTMMDDNVRPNQTVIVRNGRISTIGDSDEYFPDDDLLVIRGNGAYLMPGLADMHVHILGMPSELLLLIANGVTTARIMSGKLPLLELRDRIARNEILGPALYVSGPIIREKPVEGFGSKMSVAPQTIKETVLEIDRQTSLGYDLIKPYTYLPRHIYMAMAQTAKNQAIPIVGHIPFSMGIEGIINAGQQEVAHIHEFNKYFFSAYNQSQFFATNWPIDENRIPDIVKSVKDAGLMVTTSLWVNQMLMEANQDYSAYLKRPMMRYELASALSYMKSKEWAFSTWDPEYLRTTYIPWLHRFTKTLADNGVTLVLGTDSGYPGLLHGFSVHEELALLVRCGLTPYEAIKTATRNAAKAVQSDTSWGAIEIGNHANLLLLHRNPLEDISNIRNIIGVMKSGQWLDRSMLDDLLQQLENSSY